MMSPSYYLVLFPLLVLNKKILENKDLEAKTNQNLTCV